MAQCRFMFYLSFVTTLLGHALPHHLITQKLGLIDDPLDVRGIIYTYDVLPLRVVDAELITLLIQYQESILIAGILRVCTPSPPRAYGNSILLPIAEHLYHVIHKYTHLFSSRQLVLPAASSYYLSVPRKQDNSLITR